jgi:Xaa-Pro aminopeptidase
MLTAEGSAGRRTRLWQVLPTTLDAMIVADPVHLIYFAGFAISPFAFRANEAGGLLLLEPGRTTLVADNLLQPYAEQAHVDDVVMPVWYEGKRSTVPRRGLLVSAAIERLAQTPGNRFGIELAAVPAGVVESLRTSRPNLEILDIGPLIRTLRRAKDPDELALLRRSMRAGEAAQAAALRAVKPGMTELDAFLAVQAAAQQALGEPAIVYGDFASGPRCATDKGGPPTDRVIERGDLLLLDFSVVVDGYRGDFTNTFAVSEGPTPRQRELFDACVGALHAGEAVLRPGTAGREVDAAVRGHFKTLGLDHAFTSHSGHGIGLGHPEPPYFVPESTDTLEIGDVVALEPGLYIEGVAGMRFERNYVITEDGFETLSNHAIQIQQRPD